MWPEPCFFFYVALHLFSLISDNDVNDVVYREEEEIHKLKIELAETQRDRDMLATEVEQIRSEMKQSMTLPIQSITTDTRVGDQPGVCNISFTLKHVVKKVSYSEGKHDEKQNHICGILSMLISISLFCHFQRFDINIC